jgi:hypothetical protein
MHRFHLLKIKVLSFIRSTLASHIVPRIRYLWFINRGKKGLLTTTDDLSACKSTWSLIRMYTVNTFEWRLWRLIGLTSGPIDPSDPNLIHSIKPTFPWSISFIQVVPTGEKVCWTEDVPRGRCGRTWQGRPHLQGRPYLVVRPCLAHVARWFNFVLNVYLPIKITTQLVELC